MARATIAGLAAAKGIPASFIAKVATEDDRGVIIAYKDLDGSPARSHVRHNLESAQPSSWAKDAEKIVPFGSQLVPYYRRKNTGTLTIAEGDSDSITLWHHSIPAIGLPGVTQHGLLKLAHVDGFPEVLLALDSDKAGDAAVSPTARHLRAIGYAGRIRRLDPAPHKDLNAMHLALNGTFDDEWGQRVAVAPDVEIPTAIAATSSAPSDFMLAYDFAAQTENDVSYLVEEMLPAAGTFTIIAKPKVGKSTLGLGLSIAVARGADFLGRATRQGPVLYVALEGSAGEWKRVLRALGVQPGDAFRFFHGKRPEAVGPWLRAAIEKYHPALIVFDTLQRLVKVKDMSDYAALSNATDDLLELARSSGAPLGFLHHGGKSEKSDPIDSPLGSTAIGGSVDALLYLKRGPTHRTLQTVQRDGHDLPETIISMDADTHHVSLGGTKIEADERETGQAIIAYLKGMKEPVDEATIHENVEGRRATKMAALRALADKDEVTRSGAGRKGDPYKYGACDSKEKPHSENAGTLVPTIGAVPEKQKPEMAEKPRQIEVYSGSRDFADFDQPGTTIAGPGTTFSKIGENVDGSAEVIDL